MPLRKKFGRRRFKRRKAGGWRNMRLGTVASKAMAGVRYLKSIVNVEKHFFDATFTGTLGTAGQLFNSDSMVQGDAYNNRAGNSCLAKSVYINFLFTLGATLVEVVRVVIVLDKENRAATPATTDILESANIYSPINHTNGKRFTILRDFRCHMNANKPTCTPKVFIKLSHHIKYNDTNGGTSADFRENHIYTLLMCSDNTTPPAYALTSRLRFIDN